MAGEKWNLFSFEHGSIAVVARQERIIRVCFEGTPNEVSSAVASYYPEASHSSDPLITEGLNQLKAYFLGQRRFFDLPLAPGPLTPFANRVQQELNKVPYGAVVSYGHLAALAGSPRASRAVGGVMSANPLPLLVPCHRVVNADGRIGHYSAAHGSSTKAWLIEFERNNTK